MIRRTYLVLIVLIIVIAFIFCGGFLEAKRKMEPLDKERKENFDYHIQIMVRTDVESDFSKNFHEGALDAGKEKNVFVEFVKYNNVDELSVAVEKAIYSKVNAIALQSIDSTETEEIVKKVMDKGIFVIAYESHGDKINNITTVGSNCYTIGIKMGDMLLTSLGGKLEEEKILVFTNSMASSYSDLIKDGIKNIIGENNELIFCNLEGDSLDTKEQIKSALNTQKDKNINCIMCTDEKYTPMIGQVLIDENKVGCYTVIGLGNVVKTKNMIVDEVIYGTVCPSGYEVGYETVTQVMEGMHGRRMQNVPTTLYGITNENARESTLNIETEYFKKKEY